jgi:hypothetical protein
LERERSKLFLLLLKRKRLLEVRGPDHHRLPRRILRKSPERHFGLTKRGRKHLGRRKTRLLGSRQRGDFAISAKG